MDSTHVVYAGPTRQREMLRAGDLTARELAEAYLARIQRLDVRINSYRIVLSDRALAEARDAQEAIDAGDDRPLLGVPFAVKDSMDLEGELSCAGTSGVTTPAQADAEIVARLRDAGAVVLGKTNTPELCLWPHTETAAFGATRNPWDPNRTPGGSSGGSAAAVASGLASFATGSDGGGSIRLPAAACGLFGLKPERGRVPGSGGWNDLSANGVLTRRVQDTALILDVIGDRGPGEASFATAAGEPPDPLVIGVARNAPAPWVHVDPVILEKLDEVCDRLGTLGHKTDAIEFDYGKLKSVLPYWLRYLDGVHGDVAELDDPSALDTSTRIIGAAGALVPSVAVDWAQRAGDAVGAGTARIFDDIDLLLTPATATLPAPLGHSEMNLLELTRDAARFATFTPFWNLTGMPAASIPSGFSAGGVPVAAQLAGPMGSERTILAVAGQLEAFDDWATRRPQFD